MGNGKDPEERSTCSGQCWSLGRLLSHWGIPICDGGIALGNADL